MRAVLFSIYGRPKMKHFLLTQAHSFTQFQYETVANASASFSVAGLHEAVIVSAR